VGYHEGLPIYKDPMELAVALDGAVWKFSCSHKNTVGSQLRELAFTVVLQVARGTSLSVVPLAGVDGSGVREGLWACGAAQRVEELCLPLAAAPQGPQARRRRPHSAEGGATDKPPPGTTVTEGNQRLERRGPVVGLSARRGGACWMWQKRRWLFTGSMNKYSAWSGRRASRNKRKDGGGVSREPRGKS
jgi:hypothetical protein